jgi:hypothetical protein
MIADRPSLQMFADMPLRDDSDDRLDFKSYANAIAGVIDKPETSTPFTLGINAPWGAGKTTLGKMIDRRLGQKASAGGLSPHVTCWFDAWEYDDAPNVTSALAAHMARAAEKNRPLWRKIVNPIPNELLTRSEMHTRMILLLLNLFLLSITICEWWFPMLIRELVDAKSLSQLVRLGLRPASTLGFVYALLLLATRVITWSSEIGKSIHEVIKNPAAAANRGEVDRARTQLRTLISQATPRGSRFVIFVDNLDRCRPTRTVEVLEVGSQLLNHEGVVTVILADMARVAAAVELKYADLGKALGGRPSVSLFGRTFLQKIVHLQFDIPSYRRKDIQALIDGYIPQRIEDFSRRDSPFRKLGRAIRERWDPSLRRNLTAWTIRIWRHRIDQLVLAISKTQGKIDWFRLEYFVGFDLVTYSTGLNRLMIGESTFALIKERVQRYIEMESEKQGEDSKTVMAFLPLLPRHAKRLLNRFRLLLFVAHERNMFGHNSDLRTEHLGKWAVLMERWPEFADIVLRNPKVVTDLEWCVEHDERWQTTINQVAPWLAEEQDFRSFCRTNPELSPWMNALIAFQLEKAGDSGPSSTAKGSK